MTPLITSAVMATLLLVGPANCKPGWGGSSGGGWASPVQHYSHVWGQGQGQSDSSGEAGKQQQVQWVAAAAPSYGSSWSYSSGDDGSSWSSKGGQLSHNQALEAHRKAVEEHQRAHADALRRLDDARRSHKVSSTKQSGDSSGEKAVYRAYGTPQVVLPASSYATVYTGPKVTREETEILHADAIAKQRGLIALQQSMIAKGPASSSGKSSYKVSSGGDDSGSGEAKYYYPQVQAHAAIPAVQEVTYNYYVQKPYTGPKVTRAEAEWLHRDAIAKQQELIRKQADLVSGRDDSDDSWEDKERDDAQERHDHAKEQAVLAQQSAEVKAQTLYAKQQGEYARLAGPIEGAYRDDWSSEEAGKGGDSNSGERGYAAFVPVYHAAAAGGWGPSGSSGEVYKYNGPKLSREEAERLHADAIAKQNEIIRKHEAFIASQRSALAHRASYKVKGEDSGESGYSYASGYSGASTVNVVGPAVTNYVSSSAGYAPAAYYVKSSGSSGEATSKHQAELAKHEAQVRAQIQLAKEQGAAAAADGAYWQQAVVVPKHVVSVNQPMYYRYAAPSFGYYVPQQQWAPAIPADNSGEKQG